MLILLRSQYQHDRLLSLFQREHVFDTAVTMYLCYNPPKNGANLPRALRTRRTTPPFSLCPPQSRSCAVTHYTGRRQMNSLQDSATLMSQAVFEIDLVSEYPGTSIA